MRPEVSTRKCIAKDTLRLPSWILISPLGTYDHWLYSFPSLSRPLSLAQDAQATRTQVSNTVSVHVSYPN